MYREIVWTEQSEDHIGRHGVGPAEVEGCVNSRPVLVAAGRAGTTLVYGRTMAGRPLLVVLAGAMDGRWVVVTARDMTSAEVRALRRKGM